MEEMRSEQMNDERARHGELLAAYDKPEKLGELYAPLTDQDFAWMVRLGCVRPEPAEEEAWLAKANDLMLIGSENHHKTRGAHSTITYQARMKFLELVPKAREWEQEWIHNDSLFRSQSAGHGVSQSLPSDGFVGRQRLLQDIGLTSPYYERQLIRTRPGRILDTLNFLWKEYDIDGIALAKEVPGVGNALSFERTVIAEKFRVLTSLVRASGQDPETTRGTVVRMVEREPLLLAHHSAHVLRTLGRVSFALFEHLQAKDVDTLVHDVMRGGVLRTVAAYLRDKESIHTPSGLALKAGRMRAYGAADLRTFVAGSLEDPLVPSRSDDPVAKAYARSNPFTAKELASFTAKLGTLPGIPSPAAVNSEVTYETSRPGLTPEGYLRTLREMPELEPGVMLSLFDAIAVGLKAEKSPIDPLLYDPEMEQIVKDGRIARKRVVASLAGRLLAIPEDGNVYYSPSEDESQTALLRLTMAVIDCASYWHASPQARPAEDMETVWSLLKDQMKRTKLDKTYNERGTQEEEDEGLDYHVSPDQPIWTASRWFPPEDTKGPAMLASRVREDQIAQVLRNSGRSDSQQ